MKKPVPADKTLLDAAVLAVLKPPIQSLIRQNSEMLIEMGYQLESEGERLTNEMALEIVLDNPLPEEADKLLTRLIKEHDYEPVLKFLSRNISTY